MSSLLRFSASFRILVVAAGVGLALPASAVPQRLPPGYGASGNFLAAIVANASRDTNAAAEFFRDALKADPRNAALLDQAFIAELADGNLMESFRLAERSTARDRTNALAHVALGVKAMHEKGFAKARAHFDRAAGAARGQDLALTLFKAFALSGAREHKGAIRLVDHFTDAESRGLRDYFTGILAGIAGNSTAAEKRLGDAYKAEPGLMRLVDAYARVLAKNGKMDEAKGVLAKWKEQNPTQPYLDKLAAAVAAGGKIEPLVGNAAEGLAEVFYMLGALGQGQRDPATALIYLQMARYLSPAQDIYTLTLAEFFEQMRQNERAESLYATISPDSSFANRAAIGRAAALDRMDKNEEAIGVLKALLVRHPDDLEAADTLGAILRIKKRWADTVAVYDAAIKAAPKLEQRHAVLLFGRAIAYERLKEWPKAEPDFLSALDLLPKVPRTLREKAERAQIMNYLAYSWVDQGMNIEKSFDMLREAVSLTPGDGAVVDSLGWAYFRLGKFEDSVRELERAVLLKAGDPTINDHLGDAYYKVGRKREAAFKWHQSLELNPEPEDRIKIQKKIDLGYEAAMANAAR